MSIEELDVSIDENMLVEEWQKQPDLTLKYNTMLADAEQVFDELRAELSVLEAKLDRDVRNNPAEYGLVKATEAAVASAIPLQKKHQELTARINDARHDVRVYRGAVEAIAHRKSSLRGMTDLFQQQWWADKSGEVPEDMAESTPPKPTRTIKRRKPKTS